MPRVYCPDCDARFNATGRRAECPDCGHRFTVSTADEREERRGRRAKYSSGKNLVPLLIVGGAVAVVVLFGVVGVVLYTVVSRTRDQVRRPNVATAPVSSPAPAMDPMPGANNSPSQTQTQGRASTTPSGRGANTTQPPSSNNGTPPQNAQPAVPGQQLVALSNFRRGGGGNGFAPAPPGTISVTYEYAAGVTPGHSDVFIIKDDDGFHEADVIGPRRARGTVSFRTLGGPFGQLRGKVEMWMERKATPGPLGARGERISNIVTLS